jgi:ribosomal protein L37E
MPNAGCGRRCATVACVDSGFAASTRSAVSSSTSRAPSISWSSKLTAVSTMRMAQTRCGRHGWNVTAGACCASGTTRSFRIRKGSLRRSSDCSKPLTRLASARHPLPQCGRGAYSTLNLLKQNGPVLSDRPAAFQPVGGNYSTTTWRCVPSPSMPSSMTSPAVRNCGVGFMPRPTPGGVPVGMMSPGISVMNWLM